MICCMQCSIATTNHNVGGPLHVLSSLQSCPNCCKMLRIACRRHMGRPNKPFSDTMRLM